MMRLIYVLALVTTLAVYPGLADAAKHATGSSDCFGQLGPILAAGGYSGGLDCKTIHVDIKKVGDISLPPKIFSIYDLHYRTIPESPDMVAHGGQRLLIILNNKVYLGQYAPGLSEAGEYLKISISAKSIFIDVPTDWGSEIKFGSDGPPATVYLDQDNIDLFK